MVPHLENIKKDVIIFTSGRCMALVTIWKLAGKTKYSSLRFFNLISERI